MNSTPPSTMVTTREIVRNQLGDLFLANAELAANNASLAMQLDEKSGALTTAHGELSQLQRKLEDLSSQFSRMMRPTDDDDEFNDHDAYKLR